MKTLTAFMKKEWTEQLRTGRLIILAGLFALFGVMNPAIAKLTPWLLEAMSDLLAESGMAISVVTVSALDSWMQFYKNIPMALIAFVLLESGIFTREYRTGTLVMSLTKGLSRRKVVFSKAFVPAVIWTACFWLCFGITFGSSALFWDNSAAQSLLFSAVCCWMFGILILSLMVLFSVIGRSGTVVLAGTGGTVLVSYLLSLLPRIGRYFPTRLIDGTSLIYGMARAEDFTGALIIAIAVSAVCFAVSFPLFDRKQL